MSERIVCCIEGKMILPHLKTLYKTHSKVNIIISGNFPIYANHVDTRAICCQNTFSQILFFSRGDATIILHLATPFPVTSQAYV